MTSQESIRAFFRDAARRPEALDRSELLGFLGLEPLFMIEPSPEERSIHWCAQHDPWLALLSSSALLQEPLASDYPQPMQGRYFIGRRVEAMARWLAQSQLQAEIIAHNLPVVDPQSEQPRQTIGELDLVYRLPKENQTRHRELAAKWYLFDPDHAHPIDAQPGLEWASAWWGPKRHDRFDLKLARMRDHQIRLGQLPATRRLLGSNSPSVHELWLNGQLFWPLNRRIERSHQGSGARVNLMAVSGHWARIQTWAQTDWLHGQDAHWVALDKKEWLASWHPDPGGSICEPDENQAWAEPRLLALRKNVKTPGPWLETMRMFVVPDNWGQG